MFFSEKPCLLDPSLTPGSCLEPPWGSQMLGCDDTRIFLRKPDNKAHGQSRPDVCHVLQNGGKGERREPSLFVVLCKIVD